MILKLKNINKHKFHQQKSTIFKYDVESNKIVVSNKFPFGKNGFRYFIGYKNYYEKVMSFCILFPKMTGYRKHFDETKCIRFLIKDDELLEKYNKIWDQVSNIIEKKYLSKN